MINKVTKIFHENGPIAMGLKGYELRQQQVDMAKAICGAIRSGTHLMVEAGTGIGKSLAYLVPFIFYAVEENKKVIISTNTKTLQQQLYQKDLPFLDSHLGIDFRYCLCLGSENYACLRRLSSEGTYEMFDSDTETHDMKRIVEWSETTRTGIKSDLGFIPKPGVWDKVCRDPDLCMGVNCIFKNDCFYKKAKKCENNAHILITNHSLFFTNLASGGHVLPKEFHAVVFDEAHTLEEVAASYLGREVNNAQIRYLFNSIYNPKANKGTLTRFKGKGLIVDIVKDDLAAARAAADRFFSDVSEVMAHKSDVKRIRTKNIVIDHLGGPLGKLAASLKELTAYAEKAEDELLLKSYAKKCTEIKRSVSYILSIAKSNHVYWIESSRGRAGMRFSLFASPIEIAEELNTQLFSKIKPIVLTSATLTTGGTFDFIRSRLGVQGCDELSLDSPFDYGRNVLLYLPRNIPDPARDPKVFQEGVLEHIKEILGVMEGRTFILFTNFRMLNGVYNELKSCGMGIDLLRQGDKGRYELLDDFKKNPRSVLLGTNTFWQGVDVPGRALECVIITKLPFSVPDDPLTEARTELIDSKGKNPFLEYQVPQAIMMFKQGFGRLIRTKTDRGVVAVLDPRIRTKYYGRSFINALPKCRSTAGIEEVREFFAGQHHLLSENVFGIIKS